MAVRLVYDNSARVLADFERQVEGVLETGARITQQEAIRAITTGAKTGRVYQRPSGTHQASAKGEAPANDTGALVASITVERPGPLRRRVNVGEEYGAILELRKGRPFLLPSFYASVPIMRRMLRQIQSAGGWRPGRPLRRAVHYRSTVSPRRKP